MEQIKPLVSIIVITYNSSKYVIETLESAKAQTYQNIELIVSDDCSTDNTVEICRNWIDDNKERFVRTEMITVIKNTGIPVNCNRGVKAANGVWIKLIAGDDILFPNAISVYVEKVKINLDGIIFFARMQLFTTGKENRKGEIRPYGKEENFFELPAEKQYRYLLTKSFNMAPSAFIKKNIFNEIGGFNERYRYVEDLPVWLELTKKGFQLLFLPVTTVKYRIHDNSITRKTNGFYNVSFKRSLYLVKKELVYPNIPFYKIDFWYSELIEKIKFSVITYFFKNMRTNKSEVFFKLMGYLDIKRNLYLIAGKILKKNK